MDKTINLKSFLLLWCLIIGIGNVNAADDSTYEWVKTSYSDLQTGDIIVLVDQEQYDGAFALPNNDSNFRGVNVNVSGNKLSGTVASRIQWELKKNDDGTLTFKNGSKELAGSSDKKLIVGHGYSNFTYDNGLLSCTIDSKDYYIAWYFVGDYLAVLQEGLDGSNYIANFSFFKKQRKKIVKWKQVQGPLELATNDQVVVVDLTTSNAMKNNPPYEEEKTVSKEAPSAMKVTLKEELDRITSEFGDSIVWTADRSQGYQLYMKNSEGKTRYLFNSDQALRVGFVSSENASKKVFDIDKGLLHQVIETDDGVYTDYHVGLKVASGIQALIGGTKWELEAETESGDVNADIADTKMAFFRKEVTYLPDPSLHFPKHDYEIDIANANSFEAPVAEVEAEAGTITYYSGNTDLAEVNETTGAVTPKKRGTVRIYAQVSATDSYDDYLTSYILRIDDTRNNVKGCRTNPFTVAEAVEYAKAEGHEEETANGVCYFVKGIVSSVGGAMAGMEGMEDLLDMFSGLMESEDMGGFDISSILGMFLGEQEEGTVTYAISNNGVDRDSLAVINGRGLNLVDITVDSLSVGDWVTVYGPLEFSEDKDMMSMFGGMGGNDNQEDKRTVKMPRVNYMQEHTRNLIAEDMILYYDETKKTEDLFSITDMFNGSLVTNHNAQDTQLPMTSLKLSDTDIAEWLVNEAQTDSVLVPKMEGIITVTVNAPVLLQPGDTVKMKRKFNLDVRERKVLPAGAMDGKYELVTNLNQLKNDDKLLIVATLDNKPKVLNRKVSASGGGSNPMMSLFGGGSNGSDVTIGADGKITEVPDDAMILTLEQDGDKWRLQTGKTADLEMTYLYISDTDNGGGFGGGSIPGMGDSGAKVKTGKYEAIGDSCQVSFTFPANKNDSVKIQFNFADRVKDDKTVIAKNVIRFKKSMMSSSFGGYEAENDQAILPRLYRLVHDSRFDITIDEPGWSTIVTYTDVTTPEGLDSYVVTEVSNVNAEKTAIVRAVSALKGGEPYLLYTENSGTFTLNLSEEAVSAPMKNLLEVSDNETTDGVYVVKNAPVAGFYVWNEGLLGSGCVYLPAELGENSEFISLVIDDYPVATGISEANGNGQTTTDKTFDLQGRRVSVKNGQVKKGLYIMNGKKVVVK